MIGFLTGRYIKALNQHSLKGIVVSKYSENKWAIVKDDSGVDIDDVAIADGASIDTEAIVLGGHLCNNLGIAIEEKASAAITGSITATIMLDCGETTYETAAEAMALTVQPISAGFANKTFGEHGWLRGKMKIENNSGATINVILSRRIVA